MQTYGKCGIVAWKNKGEPHYVQFTSKWRYKRTFTKHVCAVLTLYSILFRGKFQAPLENP